jgi:hypothetical protein
MKSHIETAPLQRVPYSVTPLEGSYYGHVTFIQIRPLRREENHKCE